jgi:hypothetical protein
LDPKNELTLELVNWINSELPGSIEMQNGRFTYPILTTTPTYRPTWTAFPTETAASTEISETVQPPSATNTPHQSADPRLPTKRAVTQTPPSPPETPQPTATRAQAARQPLRCGNGMVPLAAAALWGISRRKRQPRP